MTLVEMAQTQPKSDLSSDNSSSGKIRLLKYILLLKLNPNSFNNFINNNCENQMNRTHFKRRHF